MGKKNHINTLEENQKLINEGYFNSDDERWKLIESLNNLYAVSTQGRVMSMRNGSFMKLSTKKDGYKLLVANINGEQKGIHVHRLVAEAFIPNPLNLPIINHKDENPSNNNVLNLEWCTWQYNNTYNNINKRKKKVQTAWNKGKSMKESTSSIIMIKDDNIKYFDSVSEAAKCFSEKEHIKFLTAYSKIYEALKKESHMYRGYEWRHAN